MKRKLFAIITILSLTLMLATVQPIAKASEQQVELKIVNPVTGDNKFTFNPNYTHVGDTFLADVKVFNVVGLFGWQVNITFNPNHIKVEDIYAPPDHILSGQTTLPVQKILNNQTGYVVWGLTLGPGGTPVNGTGKLCQIRFRIVKAPAKGEIIRSPIHIDQQGTYYTQLLTKEAEEIPFQPLDGEYDFSWPIKYPPPTLKVSPTKIIDPTLTPCNNASFNITILNAYNIKSIKMKIKFNSTVLNAANVLKGEILPPNAQTSHLINNELGFVAVQINTTEAYINGNGTLISLIFHISANGTSNIELQETVLIDAFGNQVEHSVENGMFSNIFIAKIAVEPQKIINPELLPPSKFSLNITIDDVVDMYEYSLTLKFNPEILSCIGIVFTEPLSETNYIPNFKVNNTEGYVQIHVQYYEPSPPITLTEPTTIATLTFRVRGIGSSNLTLENVELKNYNGQPIAYEVYNGFFMSVIRDVAALDIQASPLVIYGGQSINISITVKNEGNITESFTINIYANNTLIATYMVTDLKPNQVFQASIVWDTDNIRCGIYTLHCTIPPVPYERDLSDNEITGPTVQLKLIGDVNGDRVVNMVDIIMVIQSFGTYEGHARWNPQTDLNFDGKVDMKDILLAIANFGRSY